MNWVNVAMIISVIAMFAVGAYFLVWMTSSQKRAAAEYREQMSASADADARAPDEPVETDEADASSGSGLPDADRLRFEEQHRSSGSV